MKAVDTNFLIRSFVRDDAAQTLIADRELETGSILVTHTVLMETEWVLRSIYKWPRARINQAFVALLVIDNVTADDADMLEWALERHAAGADFADMIHLAIARKAEEFVTFDTRLSRLAGRMALPVRVAVGG